MHYIKYKKVLTGPKEPPTVFLFITIMRYSEVKKVAATFSTPFRILPPATPPLRSSTSHPGLLTSKDLITEKEHTPPLISALSR